jgi:uncharacterized membrane protein YheB (UPF0754 family)
MLHEFTAHWPAYLAVVAAAALIGWLTKVVAIELMFKPLEFVGVKIGEIPLGWQGVIPRRAAIMASVATEKIVGKLVAPADVWSRLDVDDLVEQIREPLLDSIDDITRDVAAAVQPELWNAVPEAVQDGVVERLKSSAPQVVAQVMEASQRNIDELLDLEWLTTRTLVYDKTILQRIFRETGRREWSFIRRFGLAAGCAIGVVQVVAYLWLHSAFVNPVMGAINGFATDWFCIKGLLFNPKRPKRYLGLFTWQGLFHKHQDEVSEELAGLIADYVLTPSALIENLLRGPFSDRLFLLVEREVQRLLDEEIGTAKPLVQLAVGATGYEAARVMVAEKIMDRLPETLRSSESHVEERLNLRDLLAERLRELPPEEYEQVLRPAFQQDEWTLIGTGAALGVVAGLLQDVIIKFFA